MRLKLIPQIKKLLSIPKNKMKNISQWVLGFYAGIVTIAFLMLFYSFKSLNETFEEITVKRINVIDEAGNNRMVISNQQRIPNPIIGGQEYKRRIAPAGIIFYDEKGDEVGGIAMSTLDSTGLRALSFDYANADAIGLLAQEDMDGDNFKAGIMIMDKDLSGKLGSNISRLKLTTENGVSGLVINGPDEKPRIIISVDGQGHPLFKMMDGDGHVIQNFNSSD